MTSRLLDVDMDSSLLERIDCTPNTKSQMLSLKRKASQLLDQGSPPMISAFLQWRLAVVESTLRVRTAEKQALSEARVFFDEVGKPKTVLVAAIAGNEKALLSEKAILLSQRKTLKEDLDDLVISKGQLEEAYITELRISLDAASSSKTKLFGLKSPRLDRMSFQDSVHAYLETRSKNVTDPDDAAQWCNVIGNWLPSNSVKCAHIIPFSWNTKDMAHLFGSDEPPLTSRRNGLSLQKKIEEGFDNCWVTIVPDGSVESTPTEWKLILLNSDVKDDMFFTDVLGLTDRRIWRWRDIDGRRLAFQNDNRPARRFLYMRYTLAWLHAADKSWPNFQEKVPPGTVWASPNKPDGYLRKSILLRLGEKTGDTLPADLIDAGAFEDPDTSSVVLDEVAGIRVVEHVQDHLSGARDVKVDDKEEEEAEKEEEDTG